MQIYRTFTASAMVVPLLLLKNTIDGFLCPELWIVECFPKCKIYCVNVGRLPVFVLHLNEYVNKMWRNRKTSFKWHSVALLLAREDFLHFSVFHERVYGENCI